MATPLAGDQVLAIVLTCAAPQSLDRCLHSLAAQTQRPGRVLIVDNGLPPYQFPPSVHSTRLNVDHLPTGANLGPAGGHALGIAAFTESEATWAWIMDDDCSADPFALECLLARAEASDQPKLLFPQWIDVRSGNATNYPAWCGFLLHRTVPELVGVPRADFFWWAEDTEYLGWRMKRAAIRTCRESAATVYHHRSRPAGPKPDWKLYYETRNTVYYHVWLRRLRRPRRLARILVKLAVTAIRTPPRVKRTRIFIRATRDGLRRRMGRIFAVEDPDRPNA